MTQDAGVLFSWSLQDTEGFYKEIYLQARRLTFFRVTIQNSHFFLFQISINFVQKIFFNVSTVAIVQTYCRSGPYSLHANWTPQ